MEVGTSPVELARAAVKLGLELGADEVICLVLDSERRQIRFANNQATVAKTWSDRSVKIYVGRKKRVLFSEAKTAEWKEVRGLLDRMMKDVNSLRELPNYAPIPRGPFRYPSIREAYDRRVAEAGDSLFDFVDRAINSALEAGALRVSGVLLTDTFTITVVSSGDVEAQERGSKITITVRAFADERGEAQGMGISSSRTLDRFDPDGAGREAGEVARSSLKTVKISPGTYDVVLGPYFTANLLGYSAYTFSAFFADAGVSPFVGKIGKRVASENVTIIDDPHLPNGYNSRSFDDEGYPTRRNVLIERGYLRTFVHNSMTAKKFGVERTGNAGWDIPLPWNMVMEPGDHKTEEMLEELKEGLYLLNTWYTRFQNYITGDFSTIPRDGAFLVRNGEVVGAVRGIRVSDNVIRLLSNVDAISRERRQVFWWETPVPALAPYVLVRKTKITRAFGM